MDTVTKELKTNKSYNVREVRQNFPDVDFYQVLTKELNKKNDFIKEIKHNYTYVNNLYKTVNYLLFLNYHQHTKDKLIFLKEITTLLNEYKPEHD